MFSQCLHPLFPDFSSNSAAASVSAARFFSLSCTVLSNDMAGLRRPQDVNHLILMTSKFPSNKCLWLRARGFYRVRVSDKKSEGQGWLGRREREEVRRRISATLIDRYRSPSPLAWKNTRSSMSTEINKRKPPDRSSPPLWFSRGLGVTFPHDNVVTKVTSHPTPTEASRGWVVENRDGGEIILPTHHSNSKGVPRKIDRVTAADWSDDDCQVDLFWNASGGQKMARPPPAQCRGKRCHIPRITVLFVSSDSKGAI